MAAGEVVERPASIVKELIENSVDAGATQVDIQIQEGGQKIIRIVDNGCGMASDDAVLAFSRYATSKLAAFEDLQSIDTFGFRGEALPSIASVSKLALTTRSPEKTSATRIQLKGGDVQSVSEFGAPHGTSIEVQDLFFNVPARLKFLKTPRTEAALIENVVKNFALIHPQIGFSLASDQKQLLRHQALDSDLDRRDPRRMKRIEGCLGKEVTGYVYPIDVQTDILRLSGSLVAPLVTRRDTRGIRIFVNNRSVADKDLTQMVKIAFRSLLEVGRNPICAINIQLDPSMVDVNVHPQKLEVRFSDPRRVHSHIIRVISDFLAETPWQALPNPPERKISTLSAMRVEDVSPQKMEVMHDPGHSRAGGNLSFDLIDPLSSGMPEDPSAAGSAQSMGPSDSAGMYRYLGQVRNTFLLLESNDGLYVVDQHAAHERVMFEQLKAQVNSESFQSQPLLIPIQMELSSDEQAALESSKDELTQLGFDIEPFGPEAIILKSIPVNLKLKNYEGFVRDLLSDFFCHGAGYAVRERRDQILATMACHGSVRAGQKMDRQEVDALLAQMQGTPMQAHCPHGRPVAHRIDHREIKNWFDRP